MRARILALCAALTLIVGLGAQTRQMARTEPHMSAALGHLQQARNESAADASGRPGDECGHGFECGHRNLPSIG